MQEIIQAGTGQLLRHERAFFYVTLLSYAEDSFRTGAGGIHTRARV